MSEKKGEGGMSYADEAFIAFNEIMSSHRKDTFEHISRANKGELFVLHFLAMHDVEVLPSELSAALNASTARISAVLRALEKKGQIVREIDKSNRRNILVTITDVGRERVKTEMKKMQKSLTCVFAEMGEADTAEFIRLMRIFFELSQKHKPFYPGKGCGG